MHDRIKSLVAYYTRLYETSDPFAIAKGMKIEVQSGPLGVYSGCYMFLKNHRCILINDCLEGPERIFVMGHELGHAIMHRKQDGYFLRNYTGLGSKSEWEASLFSAYLVITEEFLLEHPYAPTDIAELYGCDYRIVESRMEKRGVWI